MRPFQGMYERFQFPQYKFMEFPKAIRDKAGNTRIVHSRKEEIAVELEPAPPQGEDRASVEASRDDLAKRLAEAEAALAAERAKNQLALGAEPGAVKPTVGKVETATAPKAQKAPA